jgi:Prp8 binding protein
MPVNAQKRPADNTSLVEVPQNAKRLRNEVDLYKNKQLIEKGVNRTSSLFAPIMKLEGHEGDIFTCEFHPDGEYMGNYLMKINKLN